MKMPRKGLLMAAFATTLLICALVAGVFYFGHFQGGQPGRAATTHLDTTPRCLTAPGRSKDVICVGVAVKAVNQKTLAGFTRSTNVFPTIVEWYQQFGRPFSVVNADLVARLFGARPFVQLNPHRINLADIAAGRYDKYLKTYAKAVKSFGHEVVLSFGHEMNGTWSTWSLPFTKPKVFVAAWRHIVTVFRRQHATNALWAWDISHVGKPPRAWWPGSKYVDWVGIDGYVRVHQTFAGQFWKIITKVRTFTDNKPLLLTEVAVAPGKGQVTQIRKLFADVRLRHLVGLVWFDVNKKKNWRLVAGSRGAKAFHKAAQSS